jgi:hypothetical protein
MQATSTDTRKRPRKRAAGLALRVDLATALLALLATIFSACSAVTVVSPYDAVTDQMALTRSRGRLLTLLRTV